MALPRPVPSRPAIGGAALVALTVGLLAVPAAQAVPTGAPIELATVPGTPWELAPIPGGGTFVVQRDGGIVRLDAQDRLVAGDALARTAIPRDVRKFLGLALAPDFATSRLAYLYVSVKTAENPPGDEVNGVNGIWRLKEQDGALTVVGSEPVFDGIDSDGNHDGGRMVFGPDGALYVTTGDIHMPARPQDLNSLNGKILRLSAPASGPLTAPTDNPFSTQAGNARYVWSSGHRHPQGLAFDAAGRLWETEHGPTGEQHGDAFPGGDGKQGRDELNVITKGGNYGWPLVSGTETRPGTIAPVAVAGDSPAWAPGDVAVGADGSIYSPFLAGQELRRFDVRQGSVFGQASHVQNLGRLRVAVARGSDLLVTRDSSTGPNVLRVPLSAPTPGGSDAADPPVAPGTGGNGPRPVPAPAPVATPAAPTAPSAAQVRSRARSLARRVRTAADRLGRRRLEAGRAIVVRSTAPSVGRTTIELRLRSSRGTLLVRVRPRTTKAGVQRYVVRLGPTGRRRLRAASTRRIVVRVAHRPSSGASATTAVGLTVAKRRG
ncbi:unannotated protein [freshwater metagenome]|uniref:Unannotated protein n=1 Tax=freshwater metagenome TaxID=449393 RepID=A0A6J7KIU1_9ZZZZ